MVSTARLERRAQAESLDFTRCGLRQAIDEQDVLRVLVRCGTQADVYLGVRTCGAFDYFVSLINMRTNFIEVNRAFSRSAREPRCYVQDAVCGRAVDVARLLTDANMRTSTCESNGVDHGALLQIADIHGHDTDAFWARQKCKGRPQLETD